ncbi:GerAB/ArcD/ProY family transporter [Paenibacillus gansuensis]|uniref:GerAB/ArcD/ProY family transporter n=1 Tax=Paenibacillus gansuensis TaxID=306542 RepID=A0ABW5PIY7_9BACL
MNISIKDKFQISPILVFFLLFANLLDLGFLNYQRTLVTHAGFNAWISVILSGLSIHAIVWIIYKLFQYSKDSSNSDLVSVNRVCFGRAAGKLADIAVLLYFLLGAFLSFRGYIIIIQVWFFPEMPIWFVGITFITLLYYTITGGLRSITGLSFWGTAASVIYLIPLLFLLWKYLHPLNLLPLLDHSPIELLMSSKSMISQYTGISSILMIYPFIQSPVKSKKWSHLAVLTATAIYLIIILITYMFYSEEQLKLIVWPTLHMYMVLQIPLIQRLEYMIVPIFLISITANISLHLWMACRTAKRSLKVKQWPSLLLFLLALYTFSFFIKDYDGLRTVDKIYETIGCFFLYMYIPLLFILMKVKKMRGQLR